MQIQNDVLGHVVKSARISAGMTRDFFAEKIGKSPGFIAAIENEGSTPSYETLFKIITLLNIDPQAIFFPGKKTDNQELNDIVRLLKQCSPHELRVVKAALTAMLDNQL